MIYSRVNFIFTGFTAIRQRMAGTKGESEAAEWEKVYRVFHDFRA
jgi:hypothetical protein